MQFEAPLEKVTFLKRYKRFLADLELPDGNTVTAHCPNPGRMSSIIPASDIAYVTELGHDPSGKRKLHYRWELALVDETYVMVNTQLANKVAHQLLLHSNELRERLGIRDDSVIRPELSLPARADQKKRTRFDFGIEHAEGSPLYLEVKQISLRVDDRETGTAWGAFPDAVTARGKRHLEELAKLSREGVRATLLYIVGRSDVERIRPAFEVDPDYSQALLEAADAGVELLAAGMRATPEGIWLERWLPIDLNKATA